MPIFDRFNFLLILILILIYRWDEPTVAGKIKKKLFDI